MEPGTDAQLSEALAQAAVASGEVPMQAPTPLQSTTKSAKADLHLVDTPATTEGVTVADGEGDVSFEDAFLAETLGTEVEPEEGDGLEVAQPDAPLTKEQELANREAELDRREQEWQVQQAVQQAEQWWADKKAEGQQWANGLLKEIETYGVQHGHSDFEIERAKNNALLTTIQPWFDDYYASREESIVQPYLSAAGTDAVSTLIKEHGLTATDRAELLKYANNPETMRLVAEVMGAERAKVQVRDSKVKQQAARNVAERRTNGQFAPQGPGSAPRPTTKVTGSDSELDFMVKHRPTLRRAG